MATPDHWHKDVAIDAINAGKDVYSEKPMCRTRDEAPQMVKAARTAGRILQIGVQQRSGQIYLEPREKFVQSGAIGTHQPHRCGVEQRRPPAAAEGTGARSPPTSTGCDSWGP